MANSHLCVLCRGMNVESLAHPDGYQHVATDAGLIESAKSCTMCELIKGSLDSPKPESFARDSEYDGFICRFQQPERGSAILEINTPYRRGRLYIYAPRRDLTENDPPSTEFEIKTVSNWALKQEKSIYMTTELMRLCKEEHRCADPFQNPTIHQSDIPSHGRQRSDRVLDVFPSRLIHLTAFEVDNEMGDACLVEIDTASLGPGTEVPYTALSYCWGPDAGNMYKTESTNREDRKKRIRWAELPKTFQDAFRITRRLGIPLLWIDAICIVQDSPSDWDRESAKMGGIYANSSVVIAADASSSVSGGILDLAEDEGEGDYTGSVRITSTLNNGKESTLVFYDKLSAHIGVTWTPQAIIESPLSERTWCMQERMLSARTLHFTKKGAIWECRELYFSFTRCFKYEEMSNVKTFASIPQILSDGLPEIAWGLSNKGMTIVDGASITDEQLDSVNAVLEGLDISKLRMSEQANGSDEDKQLNSRGRAVSWWNTNVVTPYSGRRLTYISDRLPAISGMAKLFGWHLQVPYIAGLWLTELDGGLEWRRTGDTFQDAKLPNCPSFSWIAHPGPVAWPYMIDTRSTVNLFDILNHRVTLAGPDPYGRVLDAQLTFRGHVRLANLGNAEIVDRRVVRPILDDEGTTIGTADLDLDSHRYGTIDSLYCFLLYENIIGFLRLLLLVKAGGLDVDEYKRVGIGMIRPRFSYWLGGSEKKVFRLS